MPFDLAESEFTLATVARRYRDGSLSPVDVVDECLRRIERFEPRVRAWVHVDAEGARAQARQAAEKFAGGVAAGLLAGIPIGIKDLIDVQGWPTLAGSKVRDGNLAVGDAPLILNLRRAGAIILGKTVTTEFACFDPPPTRNPWNIAHTPGGSSSGSCAAAALGMCLGAIGSQTGGSITRPASFCGVAGFKPTYNMVSTQGVVPLSHALDHIGPIARRVEDLDGLFRALSSSGQSLMGSYGGEAIWPKALAPTLRINERYFVAQASPEMQQAFRSACQKLTAAGATLVPAELPGSYAEVHAMHRRILCAEAARYHREAFAARPGDFGPAIRLHIEEGLALSEGDVLEARRHRARFRAELAPGLSDAGAVTSSPDIRMEQIPQLRERMKPAVDSLWLLPAAVGAAPDLTTTGDPRFNSPWSYSGTPTASFPFALTEAGLPLGLQVASGYPLADPLVIAAARWCEGVLGFAARPGLLDEPPA